MSPSLKCSRRLQLPLVQVFKQGEPIFKLNQTYTFKIQSRGRAQYSAAVGQCKAQLLSGNPLPSGSPSNQGPRMNGILKRDSKLLEAPVEVG